MSTPGSGLDGGLKCRDWHRGHRDLREKARDRLIQDRPVNRRHLIERDITKAGEQGVKRRPDLSGNHCGAHPVKTGRGPTLDYFVKFRAVLGRRVRGGLIRPEPGVTIVLPRAIGPYFRLEQRRGASAVTDGRPDVPLQDPLLETTTAGVAGMTGRESMRPGRVTADLMSRSYGTFTESHPGPRLATNPYGAGEIVAPAGGTATRNITSTATL